MHARRALAPSSVLSVVFHYLGLTDPSLPTLEIPGCQGFLSLYPSHLQAENISALPTHRLMTAWPAWSSPSCCSYSQKATRNPFICTSIAQGQATDIAIQAEEIMKLKRQLYNIYAKHTKQSLQVIGEHPASHRTLARQRASPPG